MFDKVVGELLQALVGGDDFIVLAEKSLQQRGLVGVKIRLGALCSLCSRLEMLSLLPSRTGNIRSALGTWKFPGAFRFMARTPDFSLGPL